MGDRQLFKRCRQGGSSYNQGGGGCCVPPWGGGRLIEIEKNYFGTPFCKSEILRSRLPIYAKVVVGGKVSYIQNPAGWGRGTIYEKGSVQHVGPQARQGAIRATRARRNLYRPRQEVRHLKPAGASPLPPRGV